jgi:energy-coupling factor transporter transmembrane protein EcfT
LFFPKVFQNGEVLIANFFLLLALRRLVSLRTMKEPKEKLFDASFWILIATLFHFWSIVYIGLVFVSILLHVSRDYKNWLIPFIALFAVSILFVAINLLADFKFSQHLLSQSYLSLDFTYFETVYQNIALAIFASIALLFFLNNILTLSTRPLNLQTSYKKILFSFILGVAIYILSAEKNNSCLLFCFAPLAIMGGNFLEGLQNKILKEIVLDAIIALGIFFFIMSL